MEFGYVDTDDCSSTTDTETSERHASDILRGSIFENWLENAADREVTITPPLIEVPVIQVVPPIIRKYHKPPSQDRISFSSMNTVLICPDTDDDDDESILMPFIGDHEFDGKFPAHIITVENEKMIAMSNPQTLSILPTVQETPRDCYDSTAVSSRRTTLTHSIGAGTPIIVTPSHSRSPSSHAFEDNEEELTDTEVLTDTEELMSDRDATSVSWTEEDDVDVTETHQEDSEINSFVKGYLEEKEKREAETSFNVKRAPNRDHASPVHSTDMRAPSPHPRLSGVSEGSVSLNRRPQYVDFLASSPKKGLDLLFNDSVSEANAPPRPHGEMTSFPDVTPHFDDGPLLLPMDVYFEQQQRRTPSDRSPSLTPMDKLLESLPPLPSTKKTSIDSFHAIPTMYSSQFKTPPVNDKKPSEASDLLPTPPHSFPESSPSSKILLCKIEPEKEKSVFPLRFSKDAMQKKHDEMKTIHDRQISDVDFSDILSDDILSDFEAGPSHEVQSGIPFLTMLVNERQDIRIRVIE